MMYDARPSPAAAQRPLPQAGEVNPLHFSRLREKVASACETDEGSLPLWLPLRHTLPHATA